MTITTIYSALETDDSVPPGFDINQGGIVEPREDNAFGTTSNAGPFVVRFESPWFPGDESDPQSVRQTVTVDITMPADGWLTFWAAAAFRTGQFIIQHPQDQDFSRGMYSTAPFDWTRFYTPLSAGSNIVQIEFVTQEYDGSAHTMWLSRIAAFTDDSGATPDGQGPALPFVPDDPGDVSPAAIRHGSQTPSGYSRSDLVHHAGFLWMSLASGNTDEPTDEATDWQRMAVSDPPLLGYVFQQGDPSDDWLIPHPLSFYPNITITDSAGDAVEGDVSYPDASHVRVQFSAAFSGTAYLS